MLAMFYTVMLSDFEVNLSLVRHRPCQFDSHVQRSSPFVGSPNYNARKGSGAPIIPTASDYCFSHSFPIYFPPKEDCNLNIRGSH